jgi:uncharacterized repeat protein (TIGR02543 family)
MMKRISALFGLVAAAWLAAPATGLAQTATIYGQLGNFDVVNNTGHDAHGFEVELEGIQPADVYYTFSAQRYGAPEVLPSALGTIVRWHSAYNTSSQTYAQTTIAHAPGTGFAGTCYSWYPATYDQAGCEHFGVSLRTGAPRATSRWLIDNPASPGTLVPSDPPMAVAQPYYYVAPPVAAQPPQVVVEVQAPEPAEAPSLYGDAQWMKVFVQQLPREVTLDELVADNPLVVPMDPTQTEVNWQIIQAEPTSNGNQRRNRTRNQGGIDPTTRSVVRRFELYAFTGNYDPTTHEALCADLTCNAPGDGEIGDFLSAQMTAVNVQADTLDVTRVGNGSVDTADKVIACGNKCTSPYTGGTQVTLTAKAGSGSVFTGWTGACLGSGNNASCTTTIQGHTAVTATFSPVFTLSVGRSNKGTVTSDLTGIACGSSCSAKFAQGTTVVLTATPPAGASFVNWAGACSGTAPTCRVTVSKDTSVQAVFSK